ncbi:MAG: terminase family protein [Candidatus Sedimenticola sp. PURPLELP]
MSDPNAHKIKQLESTLAELKRRQSENQLAHYVPYPKQKAFHQLGASKRERLLMAGNQTGKTYSGAMEMAFHLTGQYPEWWQGKRFNTPIRAWALGNTSEATRDTVQRLLLGTLAEKGTGAIPKECIIETKASRGIADAVDTVLVRHKSGGISNLAFKSYEKGRMKLQGETLHVVWCDEEPPPDIYTEVLARITATKGIAFITFTPLLGMSEVVRRFLSDPSEDRAYIQMTIEDALHISLDERQRIIDGYPAHEREARVKGVPMLGSGRVFPIAESAITEEAIQIPRYWPRICGLDFGWDHPTAAVWMAWNRDADVVHIYDAHRQKEATPGLLSSTIRARGKWIPVAWPHDGLQHDKGSGETLAAIYRKEGINMLKDRATFEDGGHGVEAGVLEMLDRMQTGRLKVAAHLQEWFEEFRVYHRKEGRIVKEHDDLMAATRYAMMMLRHAKVEPRYQRNRKPRIAEGVDYDIFGDNEPHQRRRGITDAEFYELHN